MIEALNKLIEEAEAQNKAMRYPGASSTINGKTVEAYIVQQYRRNTYKYPNRKPSVMWKVDGKRIAAKDLTAAIEQ